MQILAAQNVGFALSHVSETVISKDKKYLAAKNTSGTIGVFSLETGEQICKSAMEKIAEFDYDFVSDFLAFDDERKCVIATWKGSYLGTL